MGPGAKLAAATIGAIYVLKIAALVMRGRPGGVSGWVAFLCAWPGINPEWFRQRREAASIDAGEFLGAWFRMVAGLAAIVGLAIYAPRISDTVLGLAGVGALILAVHLGVGGVLPWLVRWAGFLVPDLFRRPWEAHSLADFWSRRWNLAFGELMRGWFLRPFYGWFGKGSRLAVFVVSGALHELALSFPAGAGWGLPFAYFLLHGLLVAVEERFRIVNRAWTWFWLIAPAPWLFHSAFRRTLIVPFYWWLHNAIGAISGTAWLSYALYAAVMGHLLVLVASLQAPVRLNWKPDIAKLAPFNRKIFWVYGFYIVLSIVSFAVLTWRLHDSFLAGESAARGLAGFIAVFWTVRVLADAFWYDSRDWPAGNAMVVGHALLTSLFSSLAVVYWFAAAAPYR